MKGLSCIPVICLVVTAASAARGAEVDYARDVKPLLKQHCYTCHGALKQEAGLRLDTVEFARKGGEHGPALLAGKPPGESRIIQKISSTDAAKRMPREAKALTETEIATLSAWIAQGATGVADE